MSYYCQKCRKTGVTDLISEIRYLKGRPNFENRCFLLNMAQMSVSLKILQTNLQNETFYAKFYMRAVLSKLNQLVTFLVINLIFKRQNLQTLTAASWRDSMWRGSKNVNILSFLH